MSIRYSLKKQKLPLAKGKNKSMYFAQCKLNGKVTFDELCEKIADGNTFSRGEVAAVLYHFCEVVQSEAEMGNSVECGDLGTFRPTFSSNGVERAEDFIARRDMRPAKIRFIPKKKMKNLKVSYKKI